LIPKTSGSGTRKLAIPTTIDRMVQRAVVQVLQPFLDPVLGEHCLGYRPTSSTNRALAVAEELIVKEGRWVLVTEDLKDAFNHVPQRRLLDVLRLYIPDGRMLTLLERLVVTSTGKGLRQGGNLSPLLLNLYLHHHLDQKWHQRSNGVPLLRWADDLLALCRSTQEAQRAYSDLSQLLTPTGMQLKGTVVKTVHDLDEGTVAEWLGFELSKGESGLRVSITESAWKSLAERLELAHTKDGSPLRAIDTIKGWISQMGTCFSHTNISRAYARIVSLARNLGFEEIPSLGEVSESWQLAHIQWSQCRRVGEVSMVAARGSATRYESRPDACCAGKAS
jgi:Reverse transcriptase (RNA-dependent DNA polymerase)